MRRFRSIAGQSPAIIISLIALTFSLGTGAGYAASTISTPTPKTTWHKLTLINGWKSAANYYKPENTGYPSYAVINGVVYLSGSIYNTSSARYGNAFAVLPKGARPAHTLNIPATGAPALLGTSDDGSVFVAPTGGLYTGMISSDPHSFTFLSGISYPLGS